VQNQGYVYCTRALLSVKAAGRQILPGVDALFLGGAFCCACGAYLLAVTFFSACVLACSGRFRFSGLVLLHFGHPLSVARLFVECVNVKE
jgi:hypothetical protein